MRNYFINAMKSATPKKLLIIACLMLTTTSIVSCSSRPSDSLSEIIILEQGQNIAQRPEMAEACKGFYVSPEKLNEFFQHARPTHEQQQNSNYQKLPCYAAGVAYLADEKLHWILRAGGVGEFYNEEKRFTKICGVACCENVQGVC